MQDAGLQINGQFGNGQFWQFRHLDRDAMFKWSNTCFKMFDLNESSLKGVTNAF